MLESFLDNLPVFQRVGRSCLSIKLDTQPGVILLVGMRSVPQRLIRLFYSDIFYPIPGLVPPSNSLRSSANQN